MAVAPAWSGAVVGAGGPAQPGAAAVVAKALLPLLAVTGGDVTGRGRAGGGGAKFGSGLRPTLKSGAMRSNSTSSLFRYLIC